MTPAQTKILNFMVGKVIQRLKASGQAIPDPAIIRELVIRELEKPVDEQ